MNNNPEVTAQENSPGAMEAWPPAHSIRRSSRARNASLKISPRNGLEVILPMRWRLIDVPDLLNEKRPWIEKNAHLLQKFANSASTLQLPQHLHLQSCGEQWKISYLFSPGKTQVILRPQSELTVLGDIDDIQVCFKVLRQWLWQKAEQILAPRLFILSQELNLPFKNLTIRSQKTRWGSCSSQKSINLNFKLIFLSADIVRHIMIHELCHTVHLNHSRKFWRLVAKYDPQWRINHLTSRRVENYLPPWVEE